MTRWIDRIGIACAIAAGLFALGAQLATATHTALEFDESYNLQVPLNLYHFGRYQTWYDSPILFPHQITTGPTVLLPIAAAFAVTGPSYRTARGVLALFLLVGLWQAHRVAGRAAGRAGPFAFAAGALLFTLAPYTLWIASLTLGELPSVCLLLVGLRLLDRSLGAGRGWTAFPAGLALGLAALAKVVALIGAAGMLAALPLAAELRGRRRHAWRLGVAAAVGLALPVVAWEAVMAAGLGGAGYVEHTRRFWMLMQFGGSGLGPDGLAPAPSIAQHVGALASGMERPAWSIWGGLGLALAAVLWVALQRPRGYLYWGLTLSTAVYWTWWLRISTWLSLRHLVSGYALTAFLLPIVAGVALTDRGAARASRAVPVTALVLAALCLFPLRWPLPELSGTELRNQEAVARTAQLIHASDPLSELWGFGWRQAPELSFLAQLPFRDLTQHAPSPAAHNFFVFSGSSLFGPMTLSDYTTAHCETLVVHEGWSSLCRLRADAPQATDTIMHP